VTLGRQLRRPDLSTAGARWCEAALPEGSVYRFLARERARLFPPELFADLFQPTGRRSVPPSILAVVMVLQRLEGLSDREAADRFAFDVRWRYAAGVADAVAGEETASFAHTVLVDLRARLRRSADPDRIFRVTCALARQVGLVGVRRVLDSAPLEDAVTTQDTVTMIRGAIRGLLRACPPALEVKVRELLQREDDYRSPGKPACDWQDRAAREALVWKLDGLSEYDARRPMVPTGTNLLGLVKHVASVEAGYFGETFDRPITVQGVGEHLVVGLVGEGAVVGLDPGPEPVIGGRQDPRGDSERPGEALGDRGERLTSLERLGASEVEAEIPVTELKPGLRSELVGGLERGPGLTGPAPPLLLVGDAAERVQERVEVG
jgi:hypothetical protein